MRFFPGPKSSIRREPSVHSSDNAMSSSDQESNVIIMDSQGLLKSLKKLYGL